jgi:hypothetical protein
MKLDYGTMTSPRPIQLAIGCTIRKPTIDMVWDIGFETLGFYESFLSMTPETYFTKINPDAGKVYWEPLSDEERDSMTLYAAIVADQSLRGIYLELFRFFIEEPILYEQGFFIILNRGVDPSGSITRNDVRGAITDKLFPQLLSILKQVCGMEADEEEIDASKLKFKNKTARKMFDKMQKAKKDQKKHGKRNPNLTLQNIVSAVATRHPSINYTNIGQLTIYQVMDCFNRLQNNAFYEIDSTRVSVWGDEKKTFKPEAWYKNEYDTKQDQQ